MASGNCIGAAAGTRSKGPRLVEGIGVDIIELDRIARAVRRASFRDRVFTAAEQDYCAGCTGPERYAGRFAAKEAVAKALGVSLRWKEVEILRNSQGAPEAHLHGQAAARLAGRRLLVSISHCRSYAVAQALVERVDP
jgi:holo-[acyl-carrier protein] synthase